MTSSIPFSDPTSTPTTQPDPSTIQAGRALVGACAQEAHAGNRRWWTDNARDYYAEHGAFLGDEQLTWGPEGYTETELGLLGPLSGRTALEFGCGAAQGSRYVISQGARCVGLDVAEGMLATARNIDEHTGGSTPLVQADAIALPFAPATFDVVFSAYGATAFIADEAALLGECARVLRVGGRLVFSTSHPFRWAFPDGPSSLEATMSYFDRQPYVEMRDGRVEYAEYHRTIGDFVRAITQAQLNVIDLVEPQWPERNTDTWGGWSPLRGRHVPGTAIFVAEKRA